MISGWWREIRKRTVYTFKIKLTLPEQKTVNISNNGLILKTIKVKNLNILMERID